jgi:hypothetical protein
MDRPATGSSPNTAPSTASRGVPRVLAVSHRPGYHEWPIASDEPTRLTLDQLTLSGIGLRSVSHDLSTTGICRGIKAQRSVPGL